MRLSKVEGEKSPAHLHRSLTLELVRVTERAAIAAAEWRGKGNEQAADEAAVTAMKAELDRVAISGRIVIGEGEEPARFHRGARHGRAWRAAERCPQRLHAQDRRGSRI